MHKKTPRFTLAHRGPLKINHKYVKNKCLNIISTKMKIKVMLYDKDIYSKQEVLDFEEKKLETLNKLSNLNQGFRMQL